MVCIVEIENFSQVIVTLFYQLSLISVQQRRDEQHTHKVPEPSGRLISTESKLEQRFLH